MGQLPLTAPDLVVLAGGRGRRMGNACKGLLTVESGETVLGALLPRLAPVVGEAWIVAPEALHAQFQGRFAAGLIEDPGQGPANAMVAAARALSAERIWVVAADLPGLSPEVLKWLLRSWSGSHDAVIPVHEGRPQPLVGLYQRRALAARALPPGTSVQALLGTLSVRPSSSETLPESLRAGLGGFNTWEEAAAWGIRRPAGLANEPEPRG